MSDSLWPHSLQHARLSCPWLSPGVCSDSCPLSSWCYMTISSSPTHPLLLLPSIFPSIRVFSNELIFKSGGQSIRASASVLPMNIQVWFPLGLTSLISLLPGSPVQGTLRSLLKNHNSEASVLWHSAFFMVQGSHLYMTTGKTIALTTSSFVSKVMLCFLICCVGLS